MADTPFYLTFLIVGLLGGVHCFGMCGGIVSALSLQTENGKGHLPVHLAYNAGRLLSYVLAGMLVGMMSGAGFHWVRDQWLFRIFLYALSNVMLLALGLYLLGLPLFLAPLERLGQRLWRILQPLTRRCLPVRGMAQAFPLGMLWGWLPCGLVYSALTSALTTGSPAGGALVMLAFGLGTLPNLLLAGLLTGRLRAWIQSPWVRRLAGIGVIGFAIQGFWGVWNLVQLWLS